MAFRYFIDGYNLLYAFPELPAGSWQEKRQHLIEWLNQKRPQGNNPLTVVFDSREGLGDRFQSPDLTVVFTSGETADDWISSQVRLAANPRALVVVSNDQGIRAMVRGTGARFLSASDFLKRASKPSGNRAEGGQARAETHNAQDITDELKQKWL